MIKLKILSENRGNCEFKGEAGLSVLVEAFNNTFLLDTGFSNLFLQNAKLLNLDIASIDKVVLTHGHNDHTNGVQYLPNRKTIIMHPSAYKKRWSIRRNEFAGFPLTEEALKSKNNVITSTKPIMFFNNCYFLGEIPMIIDFEQKGNFATTLDEQLTKIDPTEDDSGIAITTNKGLFIMTGCGHRGICNVIEQAKKVTQQNKVWGVFGGFHLRSLETQKYTIDKTITYLREHKIKHLYLGHCITDEVIDYFINNLEDVNIVKISSGKECSIDLSPLK